MRLSVIIPMYNCAPVIERCLDSLEVPAEAEVLVVDDGSTDNGREVVLRYAEAHPYVRLLRKENGGVSSARNTGIESAQGKYLMFVDADDYLAPGGLERLLELAEKEDVDVLKYRILKVSNTDEADNTSIVSCRINCNRIIIGKGEALAGNTVSDFHVVDGLFRRAVLMENNIRFHTDLYLHEDDVFMAECYAVTQKVISTDLPLYRYMVCSDYSHTHNPSPERTKKIIDSALLAVQYRQAAVATLHNKTAENIERFKEMRYVYACSRNMQSARYSLGEYKAMLDRFRPFGCYPLKYKWLKVCLTVTPKLIVKTFLCNHPRLAYLIYKWKP